MPVSWWTEYTAEQVYNIWMEFAGDEDTEELPPEELATLPKKHPTAADVAAVHAMNLAAETARIKAEKEAEQKEREAILCQKNEGRAYIEEIAAAHPIQEGAPVVTIEWSEHPAFYSWEEGGLKLSVAAAEHAGGLHSRRSGGVGMRIF